MKLELDLQLVRDVADGGERVCEIFARVRAEAKRTLGYVTGVAGAPTTTTASLRLNARREKSPILYGW